MKLPNWVIPGSAVLLLGGCALLQSPIEQARTIASEAGFLPMELPDERLRGFVKRSSPPSGAGPLTVYFESDGAPWRLPDEPPNDPTPHIPMVLRMATLDPSGAVAYLGRPCQYVEANVLARCDPALWMLGRFSAEAVAAMDAAVSRIKARLGATELNLVGYSGGGAMAALVASRRTDVSCLVTMAAPLDTDAWTASIGVSALTYSLNPADIARRLQHLRQTHFRGGKDRLVPPETSGRFLRQVPQAKILDKTSYDHQCCWGDDWKEIRAESCLVN